MNLQVPETEKRAFVLYESRLQDKEELNSSMNVYMAREIVAQNISSPYNSRSRSLRQIRSRFK